jgi:phosphoadenosine phosphosulfate reductase
LIENLERTQTAAETWSPGKILRWSFETYGDRVEMASGFGVEGMVLIDLAARIYPRVRVFTLDTGFLFPETDQLIETVERRYGIAVERIRPPLSPDEQAETYGPALWRTTPDQCCALRKVEPLREKLSKLRAWITAIRREQTAARAQARKVEWDAKFQLVKINPIADWTTGRVWAYIRKNDVPYNPLHDTGYPSVGCTHCTRAVRPGEHPRAGRWSGFEKTECGLHVAEAPIPPTQFVRLDLGGTS